jgi:myb proto-oncogene protein
MARTGKWTADEDTKLSEAVGAHGGKNWEAISAQVPGRTKEQCYHRWHKKLVSNIDPTTTRLGQWKEDEYNKLRDAVGAHVVKNWKAIALLVPGRTDQQCRNRWRDALDPSISQANGRAGTWTADEVKKLKDAVRAHGATNWKAIALLVPSRTKKQCHKRWWDTLDSNIEPTTARLRILEEDEDM